MKWAYLGFVILASVFWAKMEIEIEGKNGWASDLPTWRIDKHPLLDILYGGRPLTGYHLWAFSFVFLSFHLPFFGFVPWTWQRELQAIGGYYFFWIVEDFVWFVSNPHFGIRKFSRQHIWWHKRWFLKVPLDYWILSILGLSFIFLP